MMKHSDQTTAVMQNLARRIDGVLNASEKRFGFALFVFPSDGPPGARTNYVSNVERADMIAALNEVIARFEGRVHDAPEGRQ